MEIFQLKLLSIFVITLCSFMGGILPILRINSSHFLSLGNCFGGGNFLATALVHLLSEAVEGFSDLGRAYEKHGYYYFLLGILIPFFFEKILMKHDHHSLSDTLGKKSIVSIYILISLLAVHSLIEGIALGVQTQASSTKTILFAILAHKFFAAFSLSASIAKSGVKLSWMIQLVIFFCSVSPIGVILGMILQKSIDSSIFSIAITAVASGTFMYVALVEILIDEFDERHNHKDEIIIEKETKHHNVSKMKKFLVTLLGIITTIFISSMLIDHHGDNHEVLLQVQTEAPITDFSGEHEKLLAANRHDWA